MKTSNNKISINWAQPDISEEDFYSLKDCFDSNWLSQGKKVELFEQHIATNSNRRYCVAVNSGSSALMSILIALGISNTSEIVIPALSFIALPHAATILGALPVLADIDKYTGMITQETVFPCISKDTRAVIGIDYSGFTNDWADLSEMCDELGIPLIVDSASSFLASVRGNPAGSFGKASIFSFHVAKTITTGEGGAIVTDDEKLASSLRQIRNHGEKLGHKYQYNYLGGNFRMTDIAASIGISQIQRRNQMINHRHKIISEYLKNDILKQSSLAHYRNDNYIPNGFTFTILSESRDILKQRLHNSGIDTRIMWPCIDEQPIYKHYPFKTIYELNNARYFSQSCLSLPIHLGMSEKTVSYIADVVSESSL